MKQKRSRKKHVRKSRRHFMKDYSGLYERMCIKTIDLENSGTEIQKLPIEILTDIFSYLPLRERRNARLVSKRWFDACNTIPILSTERTLCCGIYDIDEILQTLTRSRIRYWNLEFRSLKFDEYQTTFWEKCGSKIYSLTFLNCTLNSETVEKMILHCNNLQHLSWKYEFNYSEKLSGYNGQTFWPIEVLDNLIKNKIVRKNLISLELNDIWANEKWISNYLLSSIFSIFPNIKRFDFYSTYFTDNNELIDDRGLELLNKDEFTFSIILDKLSSSSNKIEGLKLRLKPSGDNSLFRLWKPISLISNLTRLREIEADIEILDVTDMDIISFFSKQEHLEFLKCTIISNSGSLTCDFIINVLNYCPKLRHLQIFGNNYVVANFEMLKKIVVTRLKSLTINIGIKSNPNTLNANHEYVNSHLRYLSLQSFNVDQTALAFLMRAFRNLKHVELSSASREVMEAIWKYQTTLRTLKVRHYLYYIDNMLTNYTSVITGIPEYAKIDFTKRLEKLEYLDIQVNLTYISEVTTLHFPRLKYLCITLDGCSKFFRKFLESIKNSPLLERAYFCCEKTTYRMWLDLCRNLKALRYLIIDGKRYDSQFTVAEYENIFAACSSLRVLRHKYSGGENKYYYDVIQKKVTSVNSEFLRRTLFANMDPFYSNWKTF